MVVGCGGEGKEKRVELLVVFKLATVVCGLVLGLLKDLIFCLERERVNL